MRNETMDFESLVRIVKVDAAEDTTLSAGTGNVVRFDATLKLSSLRNLITAKTRLLSLF